MKLRNGCFQNLNQQQEQTKLQANLKPKEIMYGKNILTLLYI